MINVAIGARYQDADGEWEVVKHDGEWVEVECIQEGNLNYGKVLMVPEMEAIIGYYGWDQIVELMDDDLREELHERLSPCGAEKFLTAYLTEHKAKYGMDFEI